MLCFLIIFPKTDINPTIMRRRCLSIVIYGTLHGKLLWCLLSITLLWCDWRDKRRCSSQHLSVVIHVVQCMTRHMIMPWHLSDVIAKIDQKSRLPQQVYRKLTKSEWNQFTSITCSLHSQVINQSKNHASPLTQRFADAKEHSTQTYCRAQSKQIQK